jgi:hypothetical protein
MSSSIVRFFSSFTIINVEMKFINLELWVDEFRFFIVGVDFDHNHLLPIA